MGEFLKSFFTVMIILVMCSGCYKQQNEPKEPDLITMNTASLNSSKKVILIVVDSLQSKALEKGIEQKKLPTFQYLTERGQYYNDFISSFPTMSVTIDSTLLTGTDPSQHHVPGLVWYSTEKKRLINYGTGTVETVRYGIDPVLWNALLHLNGRHLSEKKPTIYEELAQKGLVSGSINGLIYRGKTQHSLSLPPWLNAMSSLPEEIKVQGPDFMAFGALSNPLEDVSDLSDGLTDRMGFNDDYSIEVTSYLIRNNRLPDFLYVYLPDLDRTLHEKGPSDLSGLQEVDRKLGTLLQAFGSREEADRKAVILVMGDSGVTQLLPRSAGSTIRLHELLREFHVLQPGGTVNEETDLVLALNESMAYVYKLKPDYTLRDIADVLQTDNRIDFVSWKEKEWIHVLQGGTGKGFQYKAKGEFVDPYQQSWTLRKDAEVFHLQVNGNTLQYTDYPDVLQRLSAALNSHEGDFLVVAAKPGYELAFGGSPTHPGGGGHGSLSKTDSLFPLIIYGTGETPESRRIVDLKSFLMKLLTED
jgi:hypothetical protein